MIFLAADNTSLLTSFIFQVALATFIALIALGSIANLIKPEKNDSKLTFVLAALAGTFFSWYLFSGAYTQYQLLYNYRWVEGITIEHCKGGKGKPGFEFEYYVNGNRYTNCNTIDNIKGVGLGQKYRVRISEAVPEEGRIDFTLRLDK